MNTLSLFKDITTFIFDVDGVLTDGSVLVFNEGLQVRRMNIKDGFALQLAVTKNYRVKVISGSISPQVTDRLNRLGITDVCMGVLNKRKIVEEMMKTEGRGKEEILYMGDDLPDLPAMEIVGLPVCPNDAAREIKDISRYVSPLNGGFACVRDVIEKVMKLRGDWAYETDLTSS